jgi:hydroxyethylthiazole kinase-like uncharacterized protein yjeF
MSLPVLTPTQMRQWEQATWATGQTEANVIRRAGELVAAQALRLTRPGDRLLLLAGKGHNGDDVRAARPHLTGREVELLEVTEPKAALTALQTALAARPALVVDGLFGVGLDRPLDDAWLAFIVALNTARRRVLAVDLPSGLHAETGEPQPEAVRAEVTLALGAPKTGLLQPGAWPFTGRVELAHDIGLGAVPTGGDLRWTLAEEFRDFPPRREAHGHKGTYGHLCIIAGSQGYAGAAVLAARGALRARPGLVTLFTTQEAYYAIASQCQAVMVKVWNPDLKLPGDFTAILAGPGLAGPGVTAELPPFIRRAWRDAKVPMVVDATGLEWLIRDPVPWNTIRVVTPHPGEAGRMIKNSTEQAQSRRLHTLREVSRGHGNCLVALKGHQTLIGRNEGEVFVNPSGGPYLAQGGSGDLLSGYLAGLLAQPAGQEDALRTLRYAVWQHGAAADALEARQPNWTVEELAQELGGVRA